MIPSLITLSTFSGATGRLLTAATISSPIFCALSPSRIAEPWRSNWSTTE